MTIQQVRRQRGQALVEFTLVISILLVLVLGIIGIWPVLNAGDAVSMAASSGAHEAAITGGNQAQVETIVRENLAASGLGIDPSTAVVTITCGGTCERYAPMTVNVAVSVKPWFRLPFYKPAYTVTAQYTRASEVDGAKSSLPSSSMPPTNTNGGDMPIPGGTGGGDIGLPGDPTQ